MNDPLPSPTVLATRGIARVLHFPNQDASRGPVLVVASPIARWPHLNPRGGPSFLRSLSRAGFDVACLDWGVPTTRDRDLTWEELIARVGWARNVLAEHAGSSEVGLLGFSLGGTLAVISAALEPDGLSGLVNLAGPIDFSVAGAFVWMSDPRWFDPAFPAALYRCTPPHLLAASLALHRMSPVRTWLDHFGPMLEVSSEPLYGFAEAWAQQHVPLPPKAYTTYVRELIQRNRLVRGCHHVADRRVDLHNISCPVLAVGGRGDLICNHPASTALARHCGSKDATALVVPGGHLGSLVGRRADRTLHDPVVRWLSCRGGSTAAGVQPPS